MNDLYGPIDEKKRKLTKKPSSEKNLGDWFKRQGAPGKKEAGLTVILVEKANVKHAAAKKARKDRNTPDVDQHPALVRDIKNLKRKT